jgi:hypothetical protein
VVVVWVQGGGFGDVAAAPVARQLFSQWLLGTNGPWRPGSSTAPVTDQTLESTASTTAPSNTVIRGHAPPKASSSQLNAERTHARVLTVGRHAASTHLGRPPNARCRSRLGTRCHPGLQRRAGRQVCLVNGAIRQAFCDPVRAGWEPTHALSARLASSCAAGSNRSS